MTSDQPMVRLNGVAKRFTKGKETITIFDHLDQAGVSWRYYVAQGAEPDCADSKMFCKKQRQRAHTPDIWNPLPRPSWPIPSRPAPHSTCRLRKNGIRPSAMEENGTARGMR